MRLGAVTHNFNMSQSYVPLNFQVISGGLSVQAPANSNLAPPGPYMLFILNAAGVPSLGRFIRMP